MIRSLREPRVTPPETFNAPAHIRQTLCIQQAATATSPTIIRKPQHAARSRDEIKLPMEFVPHNRLKLPIWMERRPFLDIRPSDHSRLSSKTPHHLVLISAEPINLCQPFQLSFARHPIPMFCRSCASRAVSTITHSTACSWPLRRVQARICEINLASYAH